MRSELRDLSLAVWLLGACTGCVGSDENRGLADELGEALDPTPEYVDEPADEPLEPR
jgi:hypothetical protein